MRGTKPSDRSGGASAFVETPADSPKPWRRRLAPPATAEPARWSGRSLDRPKREGAKGIFRDDAGNTLVEFALTSTIFLMTLLGIMEFGLAVYRYNMVSDLAQEGARWATVHGYNSASPASATDVRNYVINRASGIPIDSVTTTPVPNTVGGGITVSVTVQSSYGVFSGWFPQTTFNLRSTAKMIMAR